MNEKKDQLRRKHNINVRLNDLEMAYVKDISGFLSSLGIGTDNSTVVRHALLAYATHIVYKRRDEANG
jgi:hypothetical protein